MTGPLTPPPDPTPPKGLREGALGRAATLVIGIGSTAPAYSLAASLGLVSGPVGVRAPAVLLVAFLPMLCVAVAYAAMNRRDPDCGTTFAWVGRAMGPRLGWLGGWSIIIADLLVMASLAQVAGIYTFKLVGQDALAASTPAVATVGVLWIAAMTWLCYRGIKVTARAQAVLLGIEILALGILVLAALRSAQTSPLPGAVSPALGWLNPFGVPASALSEGFLVAIFIYWGWDTAVAVNEETQHARHTPGLAAIASTVLLVVIYVLAAMGAQAYRGPAFLAAHSDDVLSALGTALLGSPGDRLIVFAVLISAAACTQTTILPTARTCLSMASAKALPAVFGRVHPKNRVPHVATLAFGVASALWYLGLVALSTDLLAASIPALGLVIAFYLGLSSVACPVMYGRALFRSVRVAIAAGLIPLLGAAVFAWVLIAGCLDLLHRGPSLLGGNLGLLTVLGLYLIGLVAMTLWRRRAPGYFERDRSGPGREPGAERQGHAEKMVR
jgi:amino acid transporter